MIVVAFILGVIGVTGCIASICLGVYIAYRKPKTETPVIDGLYRVKTVGRNKVTGAPIYEFDLVEEEKKEDVKS